MKIFKNESGYTLLLTLIIIIIIIIFFSSFTLSAMNQYKQVKKTEDNYEVTAIAEMGVEYYQSQIINLIDKYKKETFKAIEEYIRHANDLKEKTGELPHDYSHKIEQIKLEQMLLLKSSIMNLTIKGSAYNKIPLDNNKYFILLDKNDEKVPSQYELFPSEDLLEIYVRGNIAGENKVITARFDFPIDLVLPQPNGGSVVINNGKLVTPPTFPNTILPSGVVNCANIDPKAKSQSCFIDSIDNFNSSKDINNLYYIGKPIDNPSNSNIQNINGKLNSINNFFANQDIAFRGSIGTSNISVYINGYSTFFEPIDNPKDMVVYATGGGSFKNIQNINRLAVYLNGKGSFQVIKGHDLKMFTIGAVFNTVDLIKSDIEIQGDASFNETLDLHNDSNLHVTGTTTAKQIRVGNKSILYFDGPLVQQQTFEVQNHATVCIRNNYSIDTLKIKQNGNVYILDSIKNNHINNLEGSPEYLSLKEFNNKCAIPGGNTQETDTYLPIPPSTNIINSIVYQ